MVSRSASWTGVIGWPVSCWWLKAVMRALIRSCPDGTGRSSRKRSGVRVAAAGAPIGIVVVLAAVGADVTVTGLVPVAVVRIGMSGVVAAHGGSPVLALVRERASLVRARKARAGTAEEI